MKYLKTATLLALLLAGVPLYTAKAAESPLPQGHFVIYGSDAPQVGTTLQITPSSRQLVACKLANRGVIALTHEMRLCVCDGVTWIFDSNQAATCVW